MNLKSLLTIVIPTYNRYEYLLRLLRYYDSYGFPARIRVLDSSNDNQKQKRDLLNFLDHDSVEYYKFPSVVLLVHKIAQGILDIPTPYAVICADDDFMTPVGIEKCVAFLEANPDYVIAHGEYIGFRQFAKQVGTIEWRPGYKKMSLESDSPIERWRFHFSNYSLPTFYAVHRTKTLQSIFEATIKYTDDIRFGELLPTLLTVLYGKAKVVDVLYSARDGGFVPDYKRIMDFLEDNSFDLKYERFKKCLSAVMSDLAELSYNESEKLIDSVMNNYLKNKYGSSLSYCRFKAKIRRIIRLLGLLKTYRYLREFLIFNKKLKAIVESAIPCQDPSHPNYPDFMRISKYIKFKI